MIPKLALQHFHKSLPGMYPVVKYLSRLTACSQLSSNKAVLSSGCSSPTLNKHPLNGPFSATFPLFLCFLLVTSVFKCTINPTPSILPKTKRQWTRLRGNIRVLDKLLQEQVTVLLARGFNANEPITYIKWGKLTRGFRKKQEPNLIFPLVAMVQYSLTL